LGAENKGLVCIVAFNNGFETMFFLYKLCFNFMCTGRPVYFFSMRKLIVNVYEMWNVFDYSGFIETL